jgi:hypothetical protein
MTPERIRCLCPQCRTTYHAVTKANGHYASCSTCGTTFRITETMPLPATEDDILRWLSEAADKDKAAGQEVCHGPDL